MGQHIYILGAGMTGLAAGVASGLPIFEAGEVPGGICASYYMRPGSNERLRNAPKDGEAYRFEIGGGHWIFGGDPLVLRFIRSLTTVKSYVRKSAVYIPDQDLLVPYPIQNNLRYLGQEIASRALSEMVEAAQSNYPVRTMADWLRAYFGPTLCKLFFEPFHELYTAGLYKRIAPQDVYKSPVNLSLAIQGAFADVPPMGYNVTFVYPEEGLNMLAQRMAAQCNIHYSKRVVHIDVKDKIIYFEDESTAGYKALLSTLPLNKMIEMTGLIVDEEPDPATSVLIINIGAIKEKRCPNEHWVYIPKSRSGFHRAGFYSNVDASFLPASSRKDQNRVSIYVEKAYQEGERPTEDKVKDLCHAVTNELQEWGWIKEVEVVDPTWIEVAYTWSWPGSQWVKKALRLLEDHSIYQVGRFARWSFQGIADSIRDGLMAGASFRDFKN
jgi:protoporphyrinogen oxidase